MINSSNDKQLYGTAAEFTSEEGLIKAVKAALSAGFEDLEPFSPYSIHEINHMLPSSNRRVQVSALAGALLGLLGGYGMQFYMMALDYPQVVSARPFNSVPGFIQVTFEMLVLGGSFGAFFSLLFLTKLPRLYHADFEIPDFAGASRDRFFLLIRRPPDSTDAKAAHAFFNELNVAARDIYA